MTVDSFCDLAFGINVNSLSTEEESGFNQAFNQAQSASLMRFVWFPFWKVPFLQKIFPFEKRLVQAVDHLDNLIYGLVNERKKDPEVHNRTDMLSIYIQQQLKQVEHGVGKDELEITDKYIRDITLNFILGKTRRRTCILLYFAVFC